VTHTAGDDLKLLFMMKSCYSFLLHRQSRCFQKRKNNGDIVVRDGDPAKSYEIQEIRIEIISPFHHRRDQAAR